jgi:hypothetical protein
VSWFGLGWFLLAFVGPAQGIKGKVEEIKNKPFHNR